MGHGSGLTECQIPGGVVIIVEHSGHEGRNRPNSPSQGPPDQGEIEQGQWKHRQGLEDVRSNPRETQWMIS